MYINKFFKYKYNLLNEYKILIVLLIFFIIVWIIIFQFLFFYINNTNNDICKNRNKIIFHNLDNLNNYKPFLPSALKAIIEYKNNIRKGRVLYRKDNLAINDLLKNSNIFQYAYPQEKDTKIMFVYAKQVTPFLIMIFFISLFGLIVFILLIVVFVILYNKRREYYENLINIIYNKEIDDLTKIQNIDRTFEEINHYIEKRLKYWEKKELANKILIEQLEYKIKTLKNDDIYKTEVLENISHELKLPLTKIKGYIDYIYDEKMGVLSEQQKDGLFVAKRSVESLLIQIDQILHYAKDKIFTPNRQLFSMKNLLNDIIVEFTKAMKEKNIVFEINIDNIESPINGDKMAIHEVFDNLLSNALKFSKKNGKISLIGYERSIEGMNYMVFKIKDQGIGIPRDKLNKVFNRFYQVDYATSRKYQGIGLGLTIVRDILKMHNGKITVDSSVGEGTTFTVYLPIE